MNAIILSDTTLLGTNYQNTKEGIKLLKKLQSDGLKIVMLSNRPEFCMRKIGAHIDSNGHVSYQYLGACEKKGNGVDLVIYDDNNIKEQYNIKADFTIFGNGIATFDKSDNLIYLGKFISKELLSEMILEFRTQGFRSYGEYTSLLQDSLGDLCFQGREDVYKFFSPQIGTDKVNDTIYGMQCSSRSQDEDLEIISAIENKFKEIIGYRLNGKPCFYQRDVNKLTALQHLVSQYNLDLQKSEIILEEPTDKIILSSYPSSHFIGSSNNESKEKSKTLSKILNKLI